MDGHGWLGADDILREELGGEPEQVKAADERRAVGVENSEAATYIAREFGYRLLPASNRMQLVTGLERRRTPVVLRPDCDTDWESRYGHVIRVIRYSEPLLMQNGTRETHKA